MNGVLVIDKPPEWTSHDVVAKVRGVLGASKVGHLGTLDPAATGVLPLVINRATRFARWLGRGEKEYEGVMVLGVETETYDSEGRVIETRDPVGITREDIEGAFASFTGAIKQVPPMYSAVKHSGTPLYKLARKGLTVERPARDVEIFSLDILGLSVPEVFFRVRCSGGTYVRSLAHDIGGVLGCGAHLGGLTRVKSGEFTMDEAVAPTLGAEALGKAVIPLDRALGRCTTGLMSVDVDGLFSGVITVGARLKASNGSCFSPFKEQGEMIILTIDGRPSALAESLGGGSWKVRWVFGGASASGE